jgi:hypothetical protein
VRDIALEVEQLPMLTAVEGLLDLATLEGLQTDCYIDSLDIFKGIHK